MRAAVLHTLGEAPAYDAHPDPSPGPGETLVRVTAAPVVPLDLLCASGASYFGAPAVPYVPGVQGVGVVEESDTLDPGTRVWFATSAGMRPGDGGLAEHVVVRTDDAVPVVAEVADDALAALGLSAVAAWMALSWRAKLRQGESVLVLGGGGAVGQAAVGAARILGAGRVVAVSRSAEGAARATAAGADQVVVAAPDPGDLLVQLRDACAGDVDVVIDPVFGPTAEVAAQTLADGGRLVNLGGTSHDRASFSSAGLRSRSLAVLGYTNNAITIEQRRDALAEICRHAAAGDLHVAHETRPLSEIGEVWRTQASGASGRRFVLRP